MRRNEAVVLICILFLVFPAVASPQNVAPGITPIASLRFDAGLVGECLVIVEDAKAPSGEPRQTLTITCRGKQVLTFNTNSDLVSLWTNYPHDDRVIAGWEGGTGVQLSVFEIGLDGTHNPVAEVVFDERLIYMPDVENSPDVLLAYRGQRFVGAVKIPTRTDVYRWEGGKYVLDKSWQWNEGMLFEDRFCVLDTKSLTCPVTPLPTK